ncbi:lymphocyte function-associated antigen 3-like [Stigmatopora nigra]
MMANRTKKMRFLAIPVILAACCTGSKVYKKVGDDIVLKPNIEVNGPIKSILWKHGDHKAIEWDAEGSEAYRQYKHRAKVNHVNGEMTIMGLIESDSGPYTAEINFSSYTPIHLAVILAVPEPTVLASCDTERTSCTLTCAGNTTGAEPVTYEWIPTVETNSTMELIIQKETFNSDDIKCILRNPVSMKASQASKNPFLAKATGTIKINIGLTVFISLLTPIILVMLFHRCRTGMWFFQKASKPWEADFWRKQEKQHESRGTRASNGTTPHEEMRRAEEKIPMM